MTSYIDFIFADGRRDNADRPCDFPIPAALAFADRRDWRHLNQGKAFARAGSRIVPGPHQRDWEAAAYQAAIDALDAEVIGTSVTMIFDPNDDRQVHNLATGGWFISRPQRVAEVIDSILRVRHGAALGATYGALAHYVPAPSTFADQAEFAASVGRIRSAWKQRKEREAPKAPIIVRDGVRLDARGKVHT